MIKRKRILVGCEFSGIVRDAFMMMGCQSVSVDLLPSESAGPHRIADILDFVNSHWQDYDILVAFPPCTHLAVSGARWWNSKRKEQGEAIDFVNSLFHCKIPSICIENPVGILSTKWLKPTQIINPYEHGHGETKRTCLWLKNLPPLEITKRVDGRVGRVRHEPPSRDRWKKRSRTYPGIAAAMAQQWHNVIT